MSTQLPSLYSPTTPDQFIGPARSAAHRIDSLIKLSAGAAIKVLILGPPGIGKSALAAYLSVRLGCTKWTATKFNGTHLNIEAMGDLERTLHYKELFGGYRLIQIEEVDKVPHVAQVRFLTLMDDLPDKCAVVATSNCQIDELEARFQTRFMVIKLKGPSEQELHEFLTVNWPDLPKMDAKRICTFACGCVRAALLDADHALVNRLAA